jgi:hypothetical protein
MARASASTRQGPLDPADRDRAFTLELRRTCAPSLCGRLTHVASGEVVHFDSADELVRRLIDYGRAGRLPAREPR